MAPGVKSIGPRNMRVNGNVTSCSGSVASLHLSCSSPWTPSVVSRFGQVRVSNTERMAPWKSTSILRWASSRQRRQ